MTAQEEREARETIMQLWDHWRARIAAGFDGSAPRDWFESVLDHKDDEIERLEREVRYLRHYGNSAATHMADEAMARGEMESS